MPVQLRLATKLTGEQYVNARGWEQANLRECPVHGGTACGYARHGTYRRKYPDGARVARWYCKLAHRTFSLLADCFASRLPGTLVEIEEAMLAVERAASQEQAAQSLRIGVELPGVLRWLRRRLLAVRSTLITLSGLFPEPFAECRPTLSDFRIALGVAPVLPELRGIAEAYLGFLPPPLGFGPRSRRGPPFGGGFQQSAGTAPSAAVT